MFDCVMLLEVCPIIHISAQYCMRLHCVAGGFILVLVPAMFCASEDCDA